jgi:hypothetical protein
MVIPDISESSQNIPPLERSKYRFTMAGTVVL